MTHKRWKQLFMGGAAALALTSGALAGISATEGVAYAQSEESATAQTVHLVDFGRFGPGRWLRDMGPMGPRGAGVPRGIQLTDHAQALADALGITLEELQAAVTQAQEAAVQQAVDDGLITQAQADRILSQITGNIGLWNFRGVGAALARLGVDVSTIDFQALLAEQLGITVDELQAAQDEAFASLLAQAVEDGLLTQEQADQIQARHALRRYLDESNLQERLRAIFEETIQQAVEEGVITQEQADQILSQPGPGFGFGFGRGARDGFGFGPDGFGPHGFGRGGRGDFGPRGFQRDGRRGWSAPQQDTPSPEGSNHQPETSSDLTSL